MVFMDFSTPLAACLLLFIAVGVGFIFVHLIAGKFLRPNKPDAEKKTIYECGEPTIGSAWIQFDLRFYVVALLFVIFDVEVAFLFPWAEVFGKSNAVAAMEMPAKDDDQAWEDCRQKLRGLIPPWLFAVDDPQAEKRMAALNNLDQLKATTKEDFEDARNIAKTLSVFVFLEVLVFFGVLLVGFAYLWKRGDLAWVRSTLAEDTALATAPVETPVEKKELVRA
jgi:NADH-quinone oxidoreductase subunit A